METVWPNMELESQVVERHPRGSESQVVERHPLGSESQVVERHPRGSERQGEETTRVENVTIENTVNSEEQARREELNNLNRRMIIYSLLFPLATLSIETRLLMAAGVILIIIGLLLLLMYRLHYSSM